MKHNFYLLSLFFLLCGSASFAQESIRRSSARGTIDEAHIAGQLSHDAYLLHLLYNITDRTQLDRQFQENISSVEKCGTSTAIKLRDEKNSASPFVQNEIAKFLARPSKQKFFDTPGGKLRINYDTTGTHSVYQPTVDINPQNGVPDYVDRTGEIFDRVWKFEIDTLGYDAPAPDGSAGGGSNRYDIYLHKNSGAYGVTFTETFISGYLGRGGWTSYIHVDPAYDGFGYPDRTLPMKVTAAHEFHHAVQFVYNANAGVWLMEITATWMEDIAYDAINDYYFYLNDGTGMFQQPHLSLETENGAHEYSACLFNHYISENYGVNAVRKIWEETIGAVPAAIAVDSAMASYGTTLADVYAGYCVWNYFTGNRANSSHAHYSEASIYPQTKILRRIIAVPFDSTNEALPQLQHFGAYNLKIISSHQVGTFELHFDDISGSMYKGKIITDSARNYKSFNVDLSLGASIPNWQHIDSIIFIPANVDEAGGGFFFGYSGAFTPSGVTENGGVPREFLLKQNFPNPFNPATILHYALAMESNVQLTVFNIAGQEIATLLSEKKPAGEYAIRWEPQGLPSGIYFYKLQTENFTDVKKMVLMK